MLHDAVTIAVDAMGGDSGLAVTVPAVLEAVAASPGLRVILVGDQSAIEEERVRCKAVFPDQVEVRHATEVIGMTDQPSTVLRTKKDSSMRVAVELVRDGVARACVSAGNTGALMAISRLVLKTFPTIDRPAIISALPVGRGITYMLDLGANVDCNSEQLYQFALMGSVLAKQLSDVALPRVALLNIGEEQIKGNDQVKLANELLKACDDINYIGYLEGNGIFSGRADVVVCDGFVGNVALKTSEGLADHISGILNVELKRNLLSRLVALVAAPVLRRIGARLDPERYNGASFIGLKGVVVKSHGSAGVSGFVRAMELAAKEARLDIPAVIENNV